MRHRAVTRWAHDVVCFLPSCIHCRSRRMLERIVTHPLRPLMEVFRGQVSVCLFRYHFAGPMQPASWPQGKFMASSGDDRSGCCQHREGPGIIWLRKDLGGGGWGPGGETTSEERVSPSGGHHNCITLLPLLPATAKDKEQGFSSVDKHPLASSRLSPWCHFSQTWICSLCNIPGLLKPVPGRAEVLILRRGT